MGARGGGYLVESLVPYRRGEKDDIHIPTPLPQNRLSIAKKPLPQIHLDKIHLMHEHKHPCPRRIILQRLNTLTINQTILCKLPALDIKDIDQNSDVLENVVPLLLEIVLHEGILPAAVPEVEGEVAEEADVGVLDVDGGTEAARIFGDVVGEDDAAHGGFAGAGFALLGEWELGSGGLGCG